MSAARVVVLGSNAAARIAAYNLGYDKSVEVVGFTDPDPARKGALVGGKPVLGADDLLPALARDGVTGAVIAAGEPAIRARLRQRVAEAGLQLVNAIHPSAVVSPAVRLGRGVVILAGSVLSDNPVIGDNVWIGLAAVITHDTVVGDDSLIGGRSAVGAEVVIGARTVVGWGTVVGPRRRIGADTAVGFGSNVVHDIPDRVIAVGNPAKVVKERTPR